MPLLIQGVTSPFFGLALIIIGFIGVPAATRAAETDDLHPIWAITGWGIFGVALILILSTLLFGRFATSSGVLEANRYYIEQHTERRLTPQQKEGIAKYVCPAASTFEPVTFFADNEAESRQYAKEIAKEFSKCNITFVNPWYPESLITPVPAFSDNAAERGIFVSLEHEGKPDKRSKSLFEAMNRAGIPTSYSFWEGQRDPNSVYVFVAPR